MTDVFKKISDHKDIKVIVFCPDYKKEYFEENFKTTNSIIVEGVPEKGINIQDKLFGYLCRSVVNTSTLAIHRREIFLRNGKLHPYVFSFLLALAGKVKLVKRLIRWFDWRYVNKDSYGYYFDKYRPNLLFATDVYNREDVAFLAAARARKIFTIGMIRSWDNVTNKGLFRVEPDRLIVHNHIIKNEVLEINDFSQEKIFVGGVPQFDYYFTDQPGDRSKFFAEMRLDQNKKTILYIPAGIRFYDSDWQIAELLQNSVQSGFLANSQIIMRVRPNDKVELGPFNPDPNIFSICIPGKQFKPNVFRDKELTKSDLSVLLGTLYYCDIVCGDISTLAIEAAIFDKPIVITGFDVSAHTYLRSLRRFLDFTHVRKLLNTGCACVAKNPEEFIKCIKFYLDNPEADKMNRAKLVEEQVGRCDGKSGEKIANFVLAQLNLL